MTSWIDLEKEPTNLPKHETPVIVLSKYKNMFDGDTAYRGEFWGYDNNMERWYYLEKDNRTYLEGWIKPHFWIDISEPKEGINISRGIKGLISRITNYNV